MGVFSLFPFIETKFKRAIYHGPSRARTFSFDYVFLDANPLLHGAAQVIENYGDHKKMLNPYAKYSTEEKRRLIFERFFDNIIDVIENIQPGKVLYISLDGIAPRAKQNQQRERRFVGSLNRRVTDSSTGIPQFDTSNISAGTEFLFEASKFMYWKLRQYIQSKVAETITIKGKTDLKTVEIIYSPPTVPGEGEHKIMDYIRTLSQSERDNASMVLYGPDADLIYLSLAAHVKNMFLFRDSLQFPGNVDLINMNYVRRDFIPEVGHSRSVFQNKLRTEHDVSNDIIFIGFLVGNDFLPKIKMFYNLKFGLEKMNDIYKETSIGGTANFLTNGADLSFEGIMIFVNKLQQFEEEFIAEQATIVAKDPRFIDKTLLRYSKVRTIQGIEGNNTQEISEINMSEYRREYYKKAGIDFDKLTKEGISNEISKMCKSYLKGLVWVYRYYIKGLASWENAYEYHYAPFMEDLARILNNITQKEIDEITTFQMGRPALPFEQLLSILSPYSSKLLPEHYRWLMNSENSPLVKRGYYPLTFDIDYEGVKREHLGVALLPFVNFQEVSKVYREEEKTAEFRYHRNEFGKSYIFKWKDTGFLSKFESEYGTIENCRVMVTAI